MPRGKGKRGAHKGQHRHFTNEEQLQAEAEKARKNREWRAMKGLPSDEEAEEDEAAKGEGAKGEGATKKEPHEAAESGEDASSEEESSSDEEEEMKPKGVQHLIETNNPNRTDAKQIKKVSELDADGKPTLSRREREELQKQQAKAHYQKLHLQGKTDEARSDLARLTLIRKQREDAAKKRDEGKAEKEAENSAAEKRLLEKKAASK